MYSLSTIIISNIIFWLSVNIFGAAAVTSFTPKKVYSHSNIIFRERPSEHKIYKALKVGRWKDRLPVYRHNVSVFDRKRNPK